MSEKEKDFLDEMQADSTAEVEDTPETPEPETPAAATSEATTGVPAKPDATAEASPAAATDKDDRVPLAALMAERDKRQKEQTAREAMQRELEQLRADREKQTPAPGFYENPENFVQQVAQSAKQQADQRLFAVLEEDAREQFPDYQEVMDELTERVRENPALRDQIFNAPNPAKAAYRLGKQLRELQAMQDPEAYRTKLEAEFRAKWDAEQKTKDELRAKTDAELPPDLASARSASGTAVAAPGSIFQEIFA